MGTLYEALFYDAGPEQTVYCKLCPNLCKIKEGEKGRCNVRLNKQGKLYALNYGLVSSATRDPIEKKPLYHFLPGTCAYSFGTVGCNLFCQFCQNWHISRADPENYHYGFKSLSPEKAALEAEHSGCPTVAFTYNEPFIWFEWVLETATEARKRGLKNVLVTNGYIEEEPLKELLPVIDGANVDLKGDAQFYKELCKVAHQEAVLRTCKIMYEQKVHLEITTLLIPTKNDSEKQLLEMIHFILDELGPEVPLHFSRYFPNYKLNLPPTPVETLFKARTLAQKAGLKYVYLGNVLGNSGSETRCKNCGALLISRQGYYTQLVNLTKDMRCKKCSTFADILY